MSIEPEGEGPTMRETQPDGQDVHPRKVPLAIDPETFRALGHELVDAIAALLASVPGRSVTPGASPTEVREVLGADLPLPEEGEDPRTSIDRAARLLFDHSLFNGHPRFFGYITSAPAPIGMLGDFLAAAVNANVGGWILSPMASEIEMQTVRWIAELLGYPTSADGLMVSGGNMANLVAFWAARAARAPWDVRSAGMAGGRLRLRAYCSQETHTWIQKAADLSGLGTDALRWIPTDDQLRMNVSALREAVARDRRQGDLPFFVVGTAGSVSTGAVDPLPELARFCEEEGLWFHVDGAYGGLAAAVPEAPDDLRTLAAADSVAVDPHKWLYAPLEAGCVLVRDPEALRNAFSYHPPYYHFGVEAKNYFDHGPQNSRGFRALKVWLALHQAGRRGYVRMIGDDIRLARALFDRVAAHPELMPVTQGLSITTFRYVPQRLADRLGDEAVEAYLNELNREILARLERSGEVFLSNAIIHGCYALRACIVNFNTTREDIEALPEIVARYGRGVHAELREP